MHKKEQKRRFLLTNPCFYGIMHPYKEVCPKKTAFCKASPLNKEGRNKQVDFIKEDMKMMKRKMMVPVVALLLCVAMVSVGFAAWVITTTTTDTVDGQFTVYNVETRKVDLGVAFTDSTVVFGQPLNYSKADGDWLAFDSGTTSTQEDLAAKLQLTVKNWSTNTSVGSALSGKHDFTIEVSTVEIQSNGTKTNAFDNYVVCPTALTFTVDATGDVTCVNAAGEDVTSGFSFDTNTGILTVNLNFGWGTAFNGKNPITYFNGLEDGATDTNVSAANTALTELYKLHDTNTYKYALSIKADVVVN